MLDSNSKDNKTNELKRDPDYQMDIDEELGGLAIFLLKNISLYTKKLVYIKDDNYELDNSEYFIKSNYDYIFRTSRIEEGLYNKDSNAFAVHLEDMYSRVRDIKKLFDMGEYEKNDVIYRMSLIAKSLVDSHERYIENGLSSTDTYEYLAIERGSFPVTAKKIVVEINEHNQQYIWYSKMIVL